MVSIMSSIDTMHDDMIHDAQMDYYGKRLATCSTDKTVRIFEVAGDHHTLIKELRGHEGPVWQVAWAHPRFGSILASCSYDHKVIIWKETGSGWENIYEHKGHSSSVNTIAWAPSEVSDLTLACGSSDGNISFLKFKDGGWSVESVEKAHVGGVNSVSWAPFSSNSMQQLVSGGSDYMVKIWTAKDGKWDDAAEALVEGMEKSHADWVRDVAWAPSLTSSAAPSSTAYVIASCSQDGALVMWSKDKSTNGWVRRLLEDHKAPVWRCSWSITGSILAVSSADNKVTLWKESLKGDWQRVGEVDETGPSS